jgi:4-alpha-glucanotransferase
MAGRILFTAWWQFSRCESSARAAAGGTDGRSVSTFQRRCAAARGAGFRSAKTATTWRRFASSCRFAPAREILQTRCVQLTFRLRFHTRPGQSLALAGGHPLPAHPLPMKFVDAGHWEVSVPLSAHAATAPLNYSYALTADGTSATDWGRDRRLLPKSFNGDELLVLDSWNNAGFAANAFFTAPFQNVLLAENVSKIKTVAEKNSTHTFRVKAPLLQKNQTLCLIGGGDTLGNWQTTKPLLLNRDAGESELSAQVDLRGQVFPIQYKYGVFDVEKNSFVRFEDGANRVLADEIKRGKHTLVNDGFAQLPDSIWRGAGVAVPVFSLRSENSFGVGEFLDLKPLADWGKQVGLKLIQLLPVNDTSATGTWKDSYPYAAISAFALHPLYLNLAAVADAKNKKFLKPIEAARKKLNALEAVDYEAVMKLKWKFLRQIFSSQKDAAFRTAAYKTFFAENKHWLEPYAVFCFLRDKFGTADFSQWPEHKTFCTEKISALVKGNDEIALHFFVQFHLHSQLQAATAHAHKRGLVVKGDIAIGVFRHGADAWQSPELFNMDAQAGAPPDPFAAKGQNWGFPTYNWPRMAADGFAWWKKRFAQMGNYFDAFRIDHILGFFRIWSSPAHAVEGILGHFVPAIPVEEKEFSARGIYFDRERFMQPFITDAVLSEMFGDEASLIRQHFLVTTGDDQYSLKPEFSTQRAVENYFAERSAGFQHGSSPKSKPTSRAGGRRSEAADEKLKLGLFDLISNIILLEVEGKFHFRFAMEQTASFKNLAPDQQAKLRDLYVDYFFRRQDDFWKREALQKLPALKRVTNMLICGEDLGLVPACVPEVMRDLGFLSLEIQRMPKNPGQKFSRPADAPYLSVVTPGTHDMSTIRGWWTEDRAFSQKFFNGELRQPGEATCEATPEIVEAVVRQHLASPAIWSVFQLQDLLGMDGKLRCKDVESERINVPAIPNFYWRYRLHLTLEQLQKEKKINEQLLRLVRENGR